MTDVRNRHSRLGTWPLVLLILAGCIVLLIIMFYWGSARDGMYRIVVENHSDHTIKLEGHGAAATMKVAPCMIVHGTFTGPILGRPFELVLEDEQGHSLHTYNVKGRRDKYGNWPLISIAYSPNEGANCQQPVRDLYELVIENRTADSLEIACQGQIVGKWDTGETRQIGPFQGSVYDMPPLEIVGSDQRNRVGIDLYVGSKYRDIPIGEVPCVELTVVTMPGTPKAAYHAVEP